jgi:cell fate (sporulation/competence/biofilm development) regulator YlbF (YheA/YmcA/DUF963 family)
MSAEVTVSLSFELDQTVQSLGENLMAAEPLVRYRLAAEELDHNTEARSLLVSLNEAQSTMQQRQANGQVTQEDIDGLRDIQERVRANATIMNFARAQQSAILFLREVNGEISQLLGQDFGSLAGRVTC